MPERPGMVAVLSVLFLLCTFVITVFSLGSLSTSIHTEEPLTFRVEQGESLRQVTERLATEGILRNPGFVRALAVLRADSTRIKAGDYAVKGDVSPNELLDYLISGRARYAALTVPEGLNLREIARRFEEQGIGLAADFMAQATDPEYIAGLPLPPEFKGASLEGLLFPETYFVHRGVPPRQLINMMVAQFRKRALPVLLEHAATSPLSPYELLVLASIIEKETSVPEERRLISAVFLNRLRKGMVLASDPTVIYGIDNFDGNLTRAHLRTVTSYNTYKRRGLPPTPIASPGLASVRAAVDPEETDYLFFVARGDGTHQFSRDYRTHTRAVWKYQKRQGGSRNF